MKTTQYVYLILFIGTINLFSQQWQVPIYVTDGFVQDTMRIGVDPLGSDGFDPGLDVLCGTDLCEISNLLMSGYPLASDVRFNDITEKNYHLQYQPTGGGTIVLSWDPQLLAVLGSFLIVDDITGNNFGPLDMTVTGSLTVTDPLILAGLRIRVTPVSTTAISIPVNAGWNLVSLPLIVNDASYQTLFPSAITNTCFGWSGNYVMEDTLEFFNGYWLKFPVADTVQISGSVLNICQLIDLNAGWNLISCVSTEEALSDIGDPGGILIPGTLFGFNGNYFQTDTLRPGQAYWIRTSAAGQISICSGTGR